MRLLDLVRHLEDGGWTEMPRASVHQQFRHPLRVSLVTVAGDPGADIPPGTLRAIVRAAFDRDERAPAQTGHP